MATGQPTRSSKTRCFASSSSRGGSFVRHRRRQRKTVRASVASDQGFRNHAVHAYFSLDWEIVREVAEVDLPAVERAVYRLITSEYPEVAAEL
ncbi:HepT-like ribonuclease domain-containing protein [Nocardia neocaledoniensis]|uniref:HepT-like ribonuclease domain-containing protein n=1 Tax=Nocardia neocaledoniensis TaxID=236511 RepID=UPI0033E78299